MADIVDKQPADNKIKIKCRFDGYVNKFLMRGFVIDVPNQYISSPEKVDIEKSHDATFSKWVTMLNVLTRIF